MADEIAEPPHAVPDGAAVADKPAPRKVPRWPARIKPKPKEKEKRKLLEPLKAVSETILSLAKVATLILAVGAIAWIGWKIIRQDHAQRQITLEVDSKVGKFLFDRGVDFDLRAELRDEANSRINSVRSFLEGSLFTDVVFGAEGSAPISFKPFGVDITTNDMAALARLAFEGEPAFRVRMELLCEPNPCDSLRPDAKAAESGPSVQPPSSERWTRLSLIVRVSGPQRSERLVFTMPARPAAMRRGLRIAMQRSAEKLLEQVEPLIATVLYNNAPSMQIFSDEYRRYAMLAAGASFLVRSEQIRAPNEARKCLGYIVLATSLLQRGDYQNGFSNLQEIAADQEAVFQRSGETDSRARTCWIQAQTDQVFFLMGRICQSHRDHENAQSRQDLFQKIAANVQKLEKTGKLSSLEDRRIKDYKAFSALLKSLFENDNRTTVYCEISKPSDGAQLDAETVTRMLGAFNDAAPPASQHASVSGAFVTILQYVDQVAPVTELATRMKILINLRYALNPYLQEIAYPGDLYLVRGRILWNLATLVREAGKIDSRAERKALAELLLTGGSPLADADVDAWLDYEYRLLTDLAQISFENVLVSLNPHPSLNLSPHLDATILLGDVLYASDFADDSGAAARDRAQGAYAKAVRQFIDDDAPQREFIWLARAAARWANIRKREGACSEGAAQDPRWDGVWALLGASVGHRWCSIFEAGQQPGTGELGVLGILAPYIREVGTSCETQQAGGADKTPLARLSFIQCLGRQDDAAARAFFAGNTGSVIDQKITDALSGR